MRKSRNRKILVPGILAILVIVLLATVVSAIVLRGCGNKTYAKFPDEYKIASVNVGGMTVEEAKAALKKQAEDYTINMTLDGVDFNMTSDDLGISYNESADIQAICNAANKGEDYAQTSALSKTSTDNSNSKDDVKSDSGEDLAKGNKGTSESNDASASSDVSESNDASASNDVSESNASIDNSNGVIITQKLYTEGDKGVAIYNTYSEEAIQDAMLSAYTLAAQAAADEASNGGETTEAADEEQTEEANNEGESEEEGLLNPTKASIVYDEEAGLFVGVDGISGDAPNYETATKTLYEAIAKFSSSVEVESEIKYAEGEIASSSESVKIALENANRMLNLQLDCYFAPEGKDPATETIDAATIASWMMVQRDGLTVELDAETMSGYCTELAAKHDVKKTRTAKFKTTSGGEISISVAASGQTVDANLLFNGILTKLEDKTSGTINAVYNTVADEEQSEYVDFDGNYCEVDLTNQMVYVYNGGNLVVSTPVVTGCVNKGCATPAGVYSIFSMDKDRYLNGPGYKTWVNFFLPFNGGIGFHDASWRSSFGGNIYLYNGSHGCINMPYSEVKKLYENVQMGTKVILYGGATQVEGLAQTWNGTTAYTVDQGSAAFQLDSTCQGEAKLTYSSDNPGVATVDAAGIVTPVGPGTCTITINAAATTGYKASDRTVTVTVNAPAPQPEPQPQPQPQQTPQKSDAAISANSFEIMVGMSQNIGASVNSGAGLTYASSNPAIATVDGSGNVTAVAEGNVQIYITSPETDGYKAASTSITVAVKPQY